jgi:hypothetical protein
MAFKMFPWVTEDGMYDHRFFGVRYEIVNGNPKRVISSMWLEQGGPEGLEPHYLVEWGTYPDVPPKPPKK